MKVPLKHGEVILKEGPANLQRGWETVGGRLYLTNQRVVFQPHKFNIQNQISEIPIKTVKTTKKSWTKFLNLIPMVPNSLSLYTHDNAEFRFVLWGRSKWDDEIQKIIK